MYIYLYMGNSSCLCNSFSNFGLTTGDPDYELYYLWKEEFESFFLLHWLLPLHSYFSSMVVCSYQINMNELRMTFLTVSIGS